MTETASDEVTGRPDARAGGGAGLFWRYWTASTVSNAGDAVTAVALPLVAVTVLHASSLDVGLLTAASYLAWLVVGLPAGVLVERLPLRGTQVAMDVVRAAAVLSIPVAAAAGVLHLTQLVAVALVVGLASVVFDVGNATFLPTVVGKEQLTARNSLTSGSNAVTQLGGPSLGGLLVQVCGAATSLALDGVSYLVSACLLGTMPRPERHHGERQLKPASDRGPKRRPRGTPATVLIREGWHYVVRHPVVRPCVAAATLVNFVCGGLMALTPVYLVRTLGASPGLVGLLIATEGLGSLVGAALTPGLAARLGSARTILRACLCGALLALLMPLATAGPGLVLFALGNAGFAAGVVVLSILTRTHRQTHTPTELLPRVMATVRFVSWGAIPFGAVTAGLAATALGNRGALWLICGLSFLAPSALWTSGVRRMRTLG